MTNLFHVDASIFHNSTLTLVFRDSCPKSWEGNRIQLQSIVSVDVIILVPGNTLPRMHIHRTVYHIPAYRGFTRPLPHLEKETRIKMTRALSTRTENIAASLTVAIDTLAKQMIAEGKDVVSLGAEYIFIYLCHLLAHIIPLQLF